MLIDSFMFYNELDVLELRLQTLDKYVDVFILVESEVNHVGGPKECFFENNKARFSKWLPKIKHIIVRADQAPVDPDPWSREKHQRWCILKALVGVHDDAVIMISDVDEIPDLTKFTPTRVTSSIHMWMYEYSFKYLFIGEPWIGTVVTCVRLIKQFGPNHFRDKRWKFPVIQNAGWHLSSFGNAAHVLNKMHTFAHAKDGHHAAQTIETFEEFILKGIHTDGKGRLVPRPKEIPLPGPISELKRLGLL